MAEGRPGGRRWPLPVQLRPRLHADGQARSGQHNGRFPGTTSFNFSKLRCIGTSPYLGAIQVLRNAFFRKLYPHAPPRNANNV